MKAACFTVAAMDYFPQKKEYHPGGNAFNQALHFKALGFDAAFIGALGKDPYGIFLKKLLDDSYLDTSHTKMLEGISAQNRLLNDETGERFGEEGAWINGVYGEFRINEETWRFLKTFDLWSTHANCADFDRCLQEKTDRQFLAVDFLHLEAPELIEKALPKTDLLYFGGRKELAGALKEYSKLSESPLILTQGKEGAFAYWRGTEYYQEALPVDKVIDTTGCGDAFQAACTASFIKDRDIKKALLAGAEAGRKTLKHCGALDFSFIP